MVCKVVWMPEALRTYIQTIEYLKKEWTVKEVRNFINRVEQKIALLKTQPRIGRPAGRRPQVYKTVLHKRTILIYRFRPVKKEIELLSFFNTRQNSGQQKS